MSKALTIFLLWTGLTVLAVAQETSEKPIAPFLAKLPAETSWRMDFTPSASGNTSSGSSPSAAVKKQYVMIRSGDMRRDFTTWSDGTTTDVWLVKGAAFIRNPKFDHFTAYMPQDNPYGTKYPDFADLDWVNLSNFKGVQMKNGQSCFVYSVDQSKAPFPYKSPYLYASEIKLGAATIWISTTTKLPVAWQDDSSTAVYTFNLPVANLTLPDECQRVVDTINVYEKNIAGKKMVLPP